MLSIDELVTLFKAKLMVDRSVRRCTSEKLHHGLIRLQMFIISHKVWEKVMFLPLSVILFMGGGGYMMSLPVWLPGPVFLLEAFSTWVSVKGLSLWKETKTYTPFPDRDLNPPTHILTSSGLTKADGTHPTGMHSSLLYSSQGILLSRNLSVISFLIKKCHQWRMLDALQENTNAITLPASSKSEASFFMKNKYLKCKTFQVAASPSSAVATSGYTLLYTGGLMVLAPIVYACWVAKYNKKVNNS